jgi:hypothetical protein
VERDYYLIVNILFISNMKKLSVVFFCFALFVSCQNALIEKPDNLIDQEKMVDIFFDITVLEAMKSQTTLVLETNKINPNTYVYKKHHIDSLQFANSDKYYASDVKKYKEIFDAVNKRIEEQMEASKKQNTSPVPAPVQ